MRHYDSTNHDEEWTCWGARGGLIRRLFARVDVSTRGVIEEALRRRAPSAVDAVVALLESGDVAAFLATLDERTRTRDLDGGVVLEAVGILLTELRRLAEALEAEERDAALDALNRFHADVVFLVSHDKHLFDVMKDARELDVYRELFARANVGMIVYEWTAPPDLGSFRVVLMNDAAVVAGASRASLGLTLTEASSALLSSPVPARYAEVIRTKKVLSWTIDDWKTSHDDVRCYDARCFPIGETHVGVLFEDISARRRAERELARNVVELQRSNRELDDFAYVASHDLKSPLRDIHNLSSWIAEDAGANLSSETQRHLRLLGERVQRMEKLLDDLLAYSRVGRLPTAPQRVSVRATVDELRPLLQMTKHVVSVRGSEDDIEATPVAVALVLRNLVQNAIKHHDRDEGTVTIETRRVDGGVEVSVQDDGPGIPERFHDRVFRMFQTLRPRDHVESSGIGLAIVKKVLDMHAGSVRIESRGRGATVTTFWADKKGMQ